MPFSSTTWKGGDPWSWVSFGLAVFVFLGQSFGGDSADLRVYYEAVARWRVAFDFPSAYQAEALTPHKYHPATLYLFWPLALFPWGTAKLVWAALSGWCFADAGTRLIALGGETQRQAQKHLLLAAFFVIHALTWQFKFGNVTGWMLWLFVVCITSPRDWVKAAAFTILVVLKPFWIILVPVFFLHSGMLFLFKAAILFLLACLTPLLAGAPLVQTYGSWIAVLVHPIHFHNYPKQDNQSWLAFSYRYFGDTYRLLLYTLGLVPVLGPWAFALWKSRRSSGALALAATIVPMLWIGPLSWIHHEILLLPLIFLLLQRRIGKTAWIAVWVFLNGTGELFTGRAGFVTIGRSGLPMLGYLLLGALALRELLRDGRKSR